MRHLIKYTGLFVALLASSTLIYLLVTTQSSDPSSPSPTGSINIQNSLQSIWLKDINEMKKKNLFDKRINSISKIKVFMLDENLHSFLKDLKAPFKTQKKGLYTLEISFMSHFSEEDQSEKVITQYNLIQNESGNMIWELSRALNISNSKL